MFEMAEVLAQEGTYTQSAFQQKVGPRRHYYGFKSVWIGSSKDKFTVANESGLHLNAERRLGLSESGLATH